MTNTITPCTVIVRTWASNLLNSARDSSSTFGHASLETHFGGDKSLLSNPAAKAAAKGNNRGYYISFWPGKCGERYANEVEPRCREFFPHFHTLLQDLSIIRTDPSPNSKEKDDKLRETADCVYLTFTKEQIEKIHSAFETFAKSDFLWTKHGSRLIAPAHARSCAGLVEDLLNAGGIYQFVPLHIKPYARLFLEHAFTTIPATVSIAYSIYVLTSLFRKDNASAKLTSRDNDRLYSASNCMIKIGDCSKKLMQSTLNKEVYSAAKKIHESAIKTRDKVHVLWEKNSEVFKRILGITVRHVRASLLQLIGIVVFTRIFCNRLLFNIVTPANVATIASSAKKQFLEEQAHGLTLRQKHIRRWKIYMGGLFGVTGVVGMAYYVFLQVASGLANLPSR